MGAVFLAIIGPFFFTVFKTFFFSFLEGLDVYIGSSLLCNVKKKQIKPTRVILKQLVGGML